MSYALKDVCVPGLTHSMPVALPLAVKPKLSSDITQYLLGGKKQSQLRKKWITPICVLKALGGGEGRHTLETAGQCLELFMVGGKEIK